MRRLSQAVTGSRECRDLPPWHKGERVTRECPRQAVCSGISPTTRQTNGCGTNRWAARKGKGIEAYGQLPPGFRRPLRHQGRVDVAPTGRTSTEYPAHPEWRNPDGRTQRGMRNPLARTNVKVGEPRTEWEVTTLEGPSSLRVRVKRTSDRRGNEEAYRVLRKSPFYRSFASETVPSGQYAWLAGSLPRNEKAPTDQGGERMLGPFRRWSGAIPDRGTQ